MHTLKNLVFILSTGYIFLFFSEHLFWARIRPDDSWVNWLSTWVAYSLLAYVFLALVVYFRVRSLWALFLTGAVFGWLAEGVVVQTTYEMLPLSISFTGLAWHALITVCAGWYGLQKALLSASMWSSTKYAALIGFIYGLWAIAWWLEPDGGISPVPQFALFTVCITVLVMTAFWLANWSSSAPLRWNRRVVWVVLGVFLLYFALVAVPAVPIAALVLPALLGLAYLGLRHNRQAQHEPGSLLDQFSPCVRARNFVGFLALPVVAVAVYSLAMSLNIRFHTNQVLYFIVTPAGFILFGMSLYKTWRAARMAAG